MKSDFLKLHGGSVSLRTWRSVTVAWILVTGMFPHSSGAQVVSETLYDVYRISTEASVEVDNDLMVATLVVQEEDKDASMLANRVNADMTWALNILRPFTTIAVKTRDYQTYPRYENAQSRRLIGWRAQQVIELETVDFEAAGKALQKLQEKLKVQGINLSVQAESREKASDVLIENALNAFKDRARLVQRNMNSSSFRILDVDINTQHSAQRFGNAPMMRAEAATSRSVQTAPAIAAGTTTVQVQIHGRIQLD